MTPRPCYPTDIPRGARLVREGIIVQDLAVWEATEGIVVAILGDDEMVRLYAANEQLEIDEDTQQRQGRLRFARELLAQVEAGVPLDEMRF